MTATAMTWHSSPPRSLGRLTATAGSVGVAIGRQHTGELAPIRVFRPEPTRVAAVGSAWLPRLIAFRCLGAGARVEITTAAPVRWADVAGIAGTPDRVLVGGAIGRPTAVASSSLQPLLLINDVGLGGGGTESVPIGGWQTLLTAVPSLTPAAAPVVAEANVVVLQRLSAEEAEVCVSTLHLSADVETKLRQLHDDMLVVVVSGVPHFLWFATTPTEEQLLGPPHRSIV
jgi:hypothetical protein